MTPSFLKFLTIGQIVCLVALYAMSGWVAYMGAWGSGCAFAFVGTMMAEPWTLRWPEDD